MGPIAEFLSRSKRVFGAAGAALVAALSLAVFGAGSAFAQIGGVPNRFNPTDGNGVSLINGTFSYSAIEVSIGDLIWARSFYNGYSDVAAANVNGWRSNHFGTLTTWNDPGGCDYYPLPPDDYGFGPSDYAPVWIVDGGLRTPEQQYESICDPYTDWYAISIGGGAVYFKDTGDGIGPANGGAAALSHHTGTDPWTDDYWTYSPGDGSTIVFNGLVDTGDVAATAGMIRSVTAPTGDVTTYTYAHTSCAGGVTCVRLSSVNSNSGYQLKIEYAGNSTASDDPANAWQTLDKVTAINNAFEYCSPSANTCTLSGTWQWSKAEYDSPSTDVYTTTDETGRVTTYTLDGSDQLTGIKFPGSGSNDITINYSSGTVTSIVTAAGTTTYAFSCPANCSATVTEPGGATWVYGRDYSASQIGTVTDPIGRLSITRYDAQGRVVQTVSPLGVTTSYTYNEAYRGNLTQTTIAANGMTALTTSATYLSDCSGHELHCNKPETTTTADGIVTTYGYSDTHGGLLTSTTNSITTTTGYTAVHAWYLQAAGTTKADGGGLYRPTSTYVCIDSTNSCSSANKLQTTITYPTGNSTTAVNPLPISVTTGAASGGPTRTVDTTYDEFGRPKTVDGPLSGSDDTVYTLYQAWDSTSAWVEIIGPDPDGGGGLKRPAKRTTYDVRGREIRSETATVTSTAGANFTPHTYQLTTYDSAGRPSRVETWDANDTTSSGDDTLLAVTETEYNAAGLVECTAERLNASEFDTPTAACTAQAPGTLPDRITRTEYDAAGQAQKVYSVYRTDLVQFATITYNAASQPLTVTDPGGAKTTYEYDNFGRLLKTFYPDPDDVGDSSTTDYTQTTYDTATGRVSESRLRDGRIVKPTYDALGRITQAWVGRDDASLDDADEFQLNTAYDQLGRVTSESTVTSGPVTKTVTFNWDALNLTSVVSPLTVSGSPSTATVSYSYDLAGRRTQVTYPSSLVIDYDWGFLGLSQIKQSTNVLADFTYDQWGRRTTLKRGSASSPVSTSTTTFDPMSAIATLGLDLASTGNDVTRTLTRNQAGQVTNRASSAATYDHPAPSSGTTNYTNNGLNQVINAGGSSVTYVDSNGKNRGNVTAIGSDDYVYDLLNRLTGFESKTLDYDALGRLTKLVDGGTTTQFVYDGQDLIAEYDGSGTLQRQYVHGPNEDEPLVWYEGSGTGTKRYFVADELGSIVGVTDSSGALIAKRTYDEYGRPNDHSTTPGRFGYTGQVYLSEIGLYNYKARMYSPLLGRFMSPDPIGYGDGLNLYAYVGGDPINRVDPSGLCDQSTGNSTANDGITTVCPATSVGICGSQQYRGRDGHCYMRPMQCQVSCGGAGRGASRSGGGGSHTPSQEVQECHERNGRYAQGTCYVGNRNGLVEGAMAVVRAFNQATRCPVLEIEFAGGSFAQARTKDVLVGGEIMGDAGSIRVRGSIRNDGPGVKVVATRGAEGTVFAGLGENTPLSVSGRVGTVQEKQLWPGKTNLNAREPWENPSIGFFGIEEGIGLFVGANAKLGFEYPGGNRPCPTS